MDEDLCNFNDVLSLISIAKALCDIGRGDLIEEHIDDAIESDFFYDGMYSIIWDVFEAVYNDEVEDDDGEVDSIAFSDPVITDFYRMAALYGRTHNISDEENPYYKAAKDEARRWIGHSTCVHWDLPDICPEKPEDSRLTIYTYPCDCYGLDDIAFVVIMLYKWFSESCEELRKLQKVTEVAA